jgi:hypothetical protein
MIQFTPAAVRIWCKHCKKESWHQYRPGWEGVHNGRWSRVRARWVCKGERSDCDCGCSRSPDMQAADAVDNFLRDWFRSAKGFI